MLSESVGDGCVSSHEPEFKKHSHNLRCHIILNEITLSSSSMDGVSRKCWSWSCQRQRHWSMICCFNKSHIFWTKLWSPQLKSVLINNKMLVVLSGFGVWMFQDVSFTCWSAFSSKNLQQIPQARIKTENIPEVRWRKKTPTTMYYKYVFIKVCTVRA